MVGLVAPAFATLPDNTKFPVFIDLTDRCFYYSFEGLVTDADSVSVMDIQEYDAGKDVNGWLSDGARISFDLIGHIEATSDGDRLDGFGHADEFKQMIDLAASYLGGALGESAERPEPDKARPFGNVLDDDTPDSIAPQRHGHGGQTEYPEHPPRTASGLPTDTRTQTAASRGGRRMRWSRSHFLAVITWLPGRTTVTGESIVRRRRTSTKRSLR